MPCQTRHHPDDGFTLIELLIVIVILGVLAAVVVFAVGGVTDRGTVSAAAGDQRTLQTAEEVHMAQFGTYTDEQGLVTVGLLRDESDLHDITVTADLTSYTIWPAGSAPTTTAAPTPTTAPTTTVAPTPTTAPTTTVPAVGLIGTTYVTSTASHGAQVLGSGSHTLVIIGVGTGSGSTSLWATLNTTPPADTTVVWLNAGDVTTAAQVDAIMLTGPDYVVAPVSAAITNPTGPGFVGQYLNDHYPASAFWWTFAQGRDPTVAELEAAMGIT